MLVFLEMVMALAATFFSVQPVPEPDFAEIRSQELKCLIGNNVETGEHRNGYNGIFELVSVHQPVNLFVPHYSGLNLEHIFDGSSRINDRDAFFEPRVAEMRFDRTGDRIVELHQPATPHWQVETRTRFELVDPYYIDVLVRCVARRDHFEGGAFGLFWASYINGPLDKSIYFLRDDDGRSTWQQFSTQYHNHDSTVRYQRDVFEWSFSEEGRDSLFKNISRIRFADGFFYGRFRNMVWVVIFEKPEGIRFAHSPSGGGRNEKTGDTNPAWDFQWVIPDYEVGQEYRMRYRAVYKQWAGRDDVLAEVARYRELSF